MLPKKFKRVQHPIILWKRTQTSTQSDDLEGFFSISPLPKLSQQNPQQPNGESSNRVPQLLTMPSLKGFSSNPKEVFFYSDWLKDKQGISWRRFF